MSELYTPRLLLRQWRDHDLEPLARMSADPEVMRYFPACLDRAESAALIERCREHFALHGFGLWALERRDSGEFIGFTGLGHMGFEAHFTPAIEIGWRLARGHWGQGLAHEAAQAALAHGFTELGMARIIAFTAVSNLPSQRLMQSLGMRHDPADDFDHPNLPDGHPLRRHVLFTMDREHWLEQTDD